MASAGDDNAFQETVVGPSLMRLTWLEKMSVSQIIQLSCFVVLLGLGLIDAHLKRKITPRFIFIMVGLMILSIGLVILK